MGRNYEISAEQIMIDTEIPFLSLIEMEITQELNSHARLAMKVLAREESQEDIRHTDWSDTPITIWKKGESEKELMFYGGISRMACKKENRMMQLEIYGIGQTIKLDRVRKKQSFQDEKMTYGAVVQKLTNEYGNVRASWGIGKDMPIGTPLIQYEETDWEFLMRLCSHFRQPMIAEMSIENPAFSLGMRQGCRREIEDAEIVGEGFDGIFFENGCYEIGESGSRACYLEAESKKNWQMGDFVFYQGKQYHICRKKTVFGLGELVHRYYLGMEGVYSRKKMDNKALAGVCLEGVVKKVAEEKVCLQLDIDEEERADYLWNWTPETNNLCYCMPEVGTKAVLYLASPKEKDGRVILSTVKNLKSDVYTDTQKREFLTGYQKRLGLYPDRIFMEGKGGEVSFSIEDKEGIRMQSKTNITLIAEGEVYWGGKCIKATAPMELVCRTGESNIELCKNINLYAPGGVQTSGTGGKAKKKYSSGKDADSQEAEHWQASFLALAAVPAISFGTVKGEGDGIDLHTCGGIPRLAKGSSVMSMSEIMDGKKAEDASFPDCFISMGNFTVKGGYKLPEPPLGFGG